MLKIVTDSTCGLTRREADALGVDILPMTYIVSGIRKRELPLGENGDYGKLLANAGTVTTEAVRSLAFAKQFQRLLKRGCEVLCITISSRLSGTYRSAVKAAEVCNGESATPRVHVVDSWATAGALELIVRKAHTLAGESLDTAEVVRRIEEYRAHQRIVFSVPDMAVLRGSGRLGAMRRSVATVLNQYPVMELEHGAISPVTRARGVRGCARALVACAPEGVNQFIISHFGTPGPEVHHLMVALRDRFPHAALYVKDGGPVLAANIGLGAVGLSWEQIEA